MPGTRQVPNKQITLIKRKKARSVDTAPSKANYSVAIEGPCEYLLQGMASGLQWSRGWVPRALAPCGQT